jgi:hypothetical protein
MEVRSIVIGASKVVTVFVSCSLVLQSGFAQVSGQMTNENRLNKELQALIQEEPTAVERIYKSKWEKSSVGSGNNNLGNKKLGSTKGSKNIAKAKNVGKKQKNSLLLQNKNKLVKGKSQWTKANAKKMKNVGTRAAQQKKDINQKVDSLGMGNNDSQTKSTGAIQAPLVYKTDAKNSNSASSGNGRLTEYAAPKASEILIDINYRGTVSNAYSYMEISDTVSSEDLKSNRYQAKIRYGLGSTFNLGLGMEYLNKSSVTRSNELDTGTLYSSGMNDPVLLGGLVFDMSAASVQLDGEFKIPTTKDQQINVDGTDVEQDVRTGSASGKIALGVYSKSDRLIQIGGILGAEISDTIKTRTYVSQNQRETERLSKDQVRWFAQGVMEFPKHFNFGLSGKYWGPYQTTRETSVNGLNRSTTIQNGGTWEANSFIRISAAKNFDIIPNVFYGENLEATNEDVNSRARFYGLDLGFRVQF